MNRLAQIISYLFHPLLLTTWLVVVLILWVPASLVTRLDHQLTFMVFVFGITCLLPVLNLFLFRQYHMISSFEMTDVKERRVPFVFISIVYLAIAALFWYRVHLSVNFTKLMVVIAALVVTGTAITLWFRISMHTLGWGGLVGILFVLNQLTGGLLFWPVIIAVVLTGAVASSRLQLNAHTPAEVGLGGIVGLVVGYLLTGYLFLGG